MRTVGLRKMEDFVPLQETLHPRLVKRCLFRVFQVDRKRLLAQDLPRRNRLKIRHSKARPMHRVTKSPTHYPSDWAGMADFAGYCWVEGCSRENHSPVVEAGPAAGSSHVSSRGPQLEQESEVPAKVQVRMPETQRIRLVHRDVPRRARARDERSCLQATRHTKLDDHHPCMHIPNPLSSNWYIWVQHYRTEGSVKRVDFPR